MLWCFLEVYSLQRSFPFPLSVNVSTGYIFPVITHHLIFNKCNLLVVVLGFYSTYVIQRCAVRKAFAQCACCCLVPPSLLPGAAAVLSGGSATQ